MDSSSSASNSLNIFQIYSRYCEIRSESPYDSDSGGCRSESESPIVNFSREELTRLAKLAESVRMRVSLFDELYKLMSGLDLVVDFSEFSRFYDFVFFMCRENGQKNITVSKAITAWRLVLAGRFRLLKQWCDYVEKNQRHNISEDTWRQVLAFSRCVHEDLGGYDPEGAWPVLIDDFVEHMYRISGSNDHINRNFVCTCGDPDVQSCLFDDPLPGLKTIPGLKRKLCDDFGSDKLNLTDVISRGSTDLMRYKKHRQAFNGEKQGNPMNDCMELVKHNSPFSSTKSACAVEGCLAKGIAGLFSARSQLPFGHERRVSYT